MIKQIILVLLMVSMNSAYAFNASFAGDFTCSKHAEKNINNIKSNNVELLQGLGDYSYEDDQQCWIDMVEGLHVKIVRGNHESSEKGAEKSWEQLTDHFNLNSNFYSYEHKDVYVIALDTQDMNIEFLSTELERANQLKSAGQIEYVVIAMHKMIMSCMLDENLEMKYSCGDHKPSEIKDYKHIINLIYSYADTVDLVTQGHDHDTQISDNLKMINNQLVPTTNEDNLGIVWGIFGSLGRSLDKIEETNPLWQYLDGKTYQAPIFTFDKSGIHLKMISSSGDELFNKKIFLS